MGKVPEELATESPVSSSISRLNRRGKWKKSRISNGADNAENFETAESQNLGPQIYNSLYAANEKTKEEVKEVEPKATTPLTPVTEAQTELQQTTVSSIVDVVITTAAAPTTPEEYEVTTAKTPDATTVATTLAVAADESATRRMDTAADVDVEDLDTQPSIFSEVRQQLHDLFAIDENDDEAATAALAAVGKRRQEYTSIKRTRPATPTESTTEAELGEGLSLTTAATPSEKENFHKDLMEHVVYATSTSTKVTSETEICYRGRCIRSEDLPSNHKLH